MNGRNKTVLRISGNLSLYFLALFLTTQTINHIARTHLPAPYMGIMTLKQQLLALEPEIDLIFLGSSRFNSAIHPGEFDAQMARLGCPVKSFNMGIDDLNPVEASHMLRQIRQRWPDRPMRVILGQMLSRYHFYRRTWDRVRYFNTWSNLPLFIQDIWRLPSLKRDRVALMLEYLGSFVYEQASPGHLARFLFPDRQKRQDLTRIPTIRGFQLDTPEPSLQERQQFVTRIQASFTEIDQWKEQLSTRNGTAHMVRMRALIEEARALGFSTGVMLTPSILLYAIADPLSREMARVMPEVPVWNHVDPGRYPEFYQAENLQDWSHLNRHGATLLARIMAEEICPVMQRGGI